jgi:hypothetical protein
MLRFIIEGGTHLGIASCFGQREILANSLDEVKNILMKEYKEGKLTPLVMENVYWNEYVRNGVKIYNITDGEYEYFQFRVIEVQPINKRGE